MRPLATYPITGGDHGHEFYVGHPWFLELREALPVHRGPQDDPAFPLYWNTPHGRWPIHSTWRDNRSMLRLHRGLPVISKHQYAMVMDSQKCVFCYLALLCAEMLEQDQPDKVARIEQARANYLERHLGWISEAAQTCRERLSEGWPTQWITLLAACVGQSAT